MLMRQIAVNGQGSFGAMSEGLEMVSNLITSAALWNNIR
jgi:hypothetical protein